MALAPLAYRAAAPLRTSGGRAVLLFVVFTPLKLVSATFIFPPLSSAALWLPAGVSLAFLLRSPTRMWPALLVAVFVAESGVAVWPPGVPDWVVGAWGLGNVLRTLVGAVLMRRFLGGPVLLARVRDVVGLLVFGALVGPLLSATLGAGAVWLWHDGAVPLGKEWANWWMSDALGTVLVAPVVLTWWPTARRTPKPRGALETGALLAMVALVTHFIFDRRLRIEALGLADTLAYAAFPLIVVAALRQGPRGAATASAVMGFIAVHGTARGLGPFSVLPVSTFDRILAVQTFLAVLTLTALMLAAVGAERRRVALSQRVLARAGAVLTESLDWRRALPRVVELLVPELCAGGALWLARPDGVVERLAQVGWGTEHERRLRGQLPPLPQASRSWRGPDGSGVLVPMRMDGQVVGALAMVSDESGPAMGPHDRVLVEDLARRCAQAVERARLFEEAQEAIAARDEFIAIAAHELRTPLAALTLRVQGLAGQLRSVAVPDALREKLGLTVRQVARLSMLVENLLDVGRVNTRQLELRCEEVDLSELVLEVLERFRDEAARAGCALRVNVEPHLTGRLDRSRVEQALTNLLANAIKFGARRPVDVELTHDGAERARLVVRDHGIGIPPEALERIFGRFERAVSSRQYGGLGLGLYLARRIAEAHGGTVHATSPPGEGATFVLELPVEPRAPAERELPLPQPGL